MLRKFHWHPLLLAVYPVLHLLAQNTASVRPAAASLSLVVVGVASLVLLVINSLVLKSRAKGALLTSLLVGQFFSYGHLLSIMGGTDGAAGLTWALVILGLVLFIAAGVKLARYAGSLARWNRSLDVVALVLTLMVLGPIAWSEMNPATNLPLGDAKTETQTPLGYLPDIYVIVLDGFGRADKLSEIYDVDLTPLQTHLEDNGFKIAKRAFANYCQTSLSLACLLNSDYVTELLPRENRGFRDRKFLNQIVQVNRNVQHLRDMGYQLVTLAGGSELAVQDKPDVHYGGGALNEFQTTLLATTPLPLAASLFAGEAVGALDPYAQHRDGVLYQLAKLPHVVAGPGPKLVFAHVLAPHPPFVMDAKGQKVKPDYEFSVGERYAWKGYVEGYAGQVTWLAAEIQNTVDGILAASRRPPVILIMGDHGPASQWVDLYHRTGKFETTDAELIAERLAIFLAVLMPEGQGGGFYHDMTLVNVFPLIFERCFGEPLQMRPDHSYFSTYNQWSKFTNVDHITKPAR